MSRTGPTRSKSDLADMVEMLLDKGVVINADVAVSIGDTELLGVEIRAAIASFETAAKYGLEFPEGTDMERVEAAADRQGSIERELSDDESEESGESEADDESVAPKPEEGIDHPTTRPHTIPEDATEETDEGDEE